MSYLRLIILLLTRYIHSGNAECSAGCSSCLGFTCSQCESPYFLYGGNCHPCRDNCNTCENYDHCTTCKTNKWDLNSGCSNTCSETCENQVCNDDNGHCHQCKTGLYGLQCQRNCSRCENALCDLRACTYGCKSGHYDFNDGSETVCQSCRSNCKTCRNSYICDVCNDGFYSYKHISNNRVLVDCIPCLGSTQSCLDYCVIQGCDKCQVVINDSIVCTECSEGFEWNGHICLRVTSKCSDGCSTDCDDNGICLGSCNIGWTGERCSESCVSECLTCAKNNSSVCEQCKEDFYTASCNIKCPGHCYEISKQTCNIDDGFCLNDCDRAYWGPFCNESCSDGCADDGTSIICERKNGSCKLECKDGFTGPKCDTFVLTTPTTTSKAHSGVHDASTIQTLTSTPFRSEENKDYNNCFITGYFSGFGSAAMVAALIAATFLIRRRYISKKSNLLKDSSHTYYNEQVEPTADIREHNGTHNYEPLNETRQAEMTYSELQRRV